MSEGDGGNLSSEDIANGCVDYIYYEIYDPQEIGSADSEDGGMLMYKEYVSDKFKNLVEAVPDILKFAFDEDDMSYIILSGGADFN